MSENDQKNEDAAMINEQEMVSDSIEPEQSYTTQQMDILNNVTMNITVQIGKAKIKISELLNLKKGSIVELHQEANEPLQIYANEKPIAKGTIITANGKYCVKVI